MKRRVVSENDKPDDNDDMINMAPDEDFDLEPTQENQEVHPDVLIEIQEIRNKLAEVIPALLSRWDKYFEFKSDKALRVRATKKEKVTDDILKGFLINLVHKVKKYQVYSVREFELELPCGSQITDKGIKDLAEYLKKCFTNLERLSLNILDCEKLTDQGIEALAAGISQNHKSLQFLCLRLAASYYPSYLFEPTRQFRLSDKSLQTLGTNISVNLSNLSQLTLDFSHCYDITDAGVNKLIMAIGERLRGLKELTLCFDCCYDVADNGVQSIASTLNNLSGLRVFGLNFNGCWKITDKAFSILGEKIFTNLKHLKMLNLDFSRCWKISNEGVRVLSSAIRENVNDQLNNFKLSLAWCDKITNQGVTMIEGAICHGFPELNHLTLNFAGCLKVTHGEIEYCALSINQALKNITHLKLYLAWLREKSGEEKIRQEIETPPGPEQSNLCLEWDEKIAGDIERRIKERCNHTIRVEVR